MRLPDEQVLDKAGILANFRKIVRELKDLQGVNRVTSLPISPQDGDEIYFLADATNGVVWHLKYRATSSSAYKWEYIGGPPLRDWVNTAEARTNAAYGDLATAGPQVTLPLAGDYDIEHGATVSMTVNERGNITVKPGAGAAADTESVQVAGATGGAAEEASVSRQQRFLGRSASEVMKLQYSTAGGTVNFFYRWIALTPVRVG